MTQPEIRWFKVCRADELRPGTARSISLVARKFAVFNVDGKLYGMDGACGHMKASLASGRLTQTVIECSMHGWQYDVTTGECVTGEDEPLRTYPAKIEDHDVLIGLPWPFGESV